MLTLAREPIVVMPDGQIVDGFHRWTLARRDADVRAMTDGLVPVVRVNLDRVAQVLATVRHNRARGQHGVLRMGEIVRELVGKVGAAGVQRDLGMEPEEVARLAETRGIQEQRGRDAYNKSWVPS